MAKRKELDEELRSPSLRSGAVRRGPRACAISAEANETCGAWLSWKTGCARRAGPMTKAGRRRSAEIRKLMLESTIELLSFEYRGSRVAIGADSRYTIVEFV
jgi:hypothetical protein